MDAAPSFWHQRSVLVTGCTGFLGGAVARELLKNGATVVGLVRDRTRAAEFSSEITKGRFRMVLGRAEDAGRLHASMVIHETSAVFHLADTDRGLAAAVRAVGLYSPQVPVITARPAADSCKHDENGSQAYRLGIARFGEVFGPRDRKRFHTIPKVIRATLSGDDPGPTSGPARDFVFVRDAARACLHLAEEVLATSHPMDCEFRTGWEFTDAAMTEMIAAAVAGQLPSAPSVVPGNPHGWQPEIPLPDALRETVEWFKRAIASEAIPSTGPIRRAA